MKYVAICIAIYDYQSQNDEEISFNTDDTLYILENEDPDWYKAQLKVPNQIEGGPIGLVPSNYLEKAKDIGTVKAIYDYTSQSVEELSVKEDEQLTLFEKDDPDWFVVENLKGEIGLVPSNYVEEQQATTKTPVATPAVQTKSFVQQPEVREEPQSICEPKWAIALYSFQPASEEETFLEDNEQILVMDYVTSKDWWTIEHKDGVTTGLVPASYVQFHEEYEAKLKAEQEELEKGKQKEALEKELADKKKREQEMAEIERKRKEEYEQRDKERQRELAERNRIREQEEKEKARQLEVERRRKMQEEAKQKEIEAKRQASFAAAAIASPQLGGGSPRRSQIPAPPPPNKSVPEPHNDPNKPDPVKVRQWTDRTGAFKVEAQFVSCANGKIRLFKTNGVKIDVPTQKMCLEDLYYIEKETGMKLVEDKTDNIPLGQLGRFSWFDYFKRANLPHNACIQYAKSFDQNGLGEHDVENLTHRKMKSLGMNERHVQRIQRFIETNRADPPSDDESSGPKLKGKKSVTFGAVSYIEEKDQDEEEYEVGSVQWQIEQDERLARELQEQEQQYSSGSSTLHRRGTGRPIPNHSAPKGVNSNILTPQQFNPEPLKPTPAINKPQPSTQPIQPLQSQPQPSLQQTPIPPPKQQASFEDDAWAPRSSPSIINNHISSTPPQMPPRQRPTPPAQQQQQQPSLVDPQLLAKWGGSPALAAANSNRPVPPPPASSMSSSINSLQAQQQQQQALFYQQQQALVNTTALPQQQAVLPTGFTPSAQQQQALPTGNNFSSLQQPLATGNSSFTSLPVGNNSFTSLPSTGNNSFASLPNNSYTSLPSQQLSLSTAGSLNSYTTANTSSQPQQQFSNPLQPQQTGFTPLQALQPTGVFVPSPSFVNTTVQQFNNSPQITANSRNWAAATPDNPFGGGSPMPPAKNFQQQSFNQNQGYLPQQQQFNNPSSIDPNDKYSVFKTVNPSQSTVFNNQQFYR